MKKPPFQSACVFSPASAECIDSMRDAEKAYYPTPIEPYAVNPNTWNVQPLPVNQSSSFQIPTWAIIGGIVLLFMLGGSNGKR